MKPYALITGAAGGMGSEITKALAQAGYPIIMACRDLKKAEFKRAQIIQETGNSQIEIEYLNLASLQEVKKFSEKIKQKQIKIGLLMNNAGMMPCHFSKTKDGLEETVSVNYLGTVLLTRLLEDCMIQGSRIVNMVSLTYKYGQLDFDDFFTQGKKGGFSRLSIYSNTKLALTLFTLKYAEMVKFKGITVNAADPGIVSTPIIRMNKWFDVLTDWFYRPLIRTPRQGADTAIRLLLDAEYESQTGNCYKNGKKINLKFSTQNHELLKEELWQKTEEIFQNNVNFSENNPL